MLYIFLTVILVILDQITKVLSKLYLKPIGTKVIIDNIFSFSYVENFGAAWGIMQNSRWFFVIMTLIILIGGAIYLNKNKIKSKIFKLSTALIYAGAIGNLIDRLIFGYVTDFLEITFISYPVFNIADCCVVIGAVLLGIYLIFFEGKNNA